MNTRMVACVVLVSAACFATHAIATKASPQAGFSPKACLASNGLAYGPFRDGQSPDPKAPGPSVAEIEEDLKSLRGITRNIRTYGTANNLAEIPRIAKALGFDVTLGIALGKDRNQNEAEIQTALRLVREGHVDLLIAGNETITGGLLTKPELLAYIRDVRTRVRRAVPVTTAEVVGIWQANLDLAADVDNVVAHFYPFWEGHSIEGAATSVLEQYQRLETSLRARYPGRNLKVIVGETGWPSAETPNSTGAKATLQNQYRYFKEFTAVACANTIPFFYFEAFDEEWKWEEGANSSRGSRVLPRDRTLAGRWVGSSWGLFQSNGGPKPHFVPVTGPMNQTSRRIRTIWNEGLATYYDIGLDTSEGRRDWLTAASGMLKMAYPRGQEWGSVFVTVGMPTQRPRPWRDFSEFVAISFDIRGEQGGESVAVTIKDFADPGLGDERRIVIPSISTKFETRTVQLRQFASPRLLIPDGLKQLNVVLAFVFSGPRPATIYATRIRYLPAD